MAGLEHKINSGLAMAGLLSLNHAQMVGLIVVWVCVVVGGLCRLAVVFRWPNRCWYGDWVAGLVVLVFGGHGMGCGLLVVWCLLVIGGFFFFFFTYFVGGFCLGGVCVMVGWCWLLPCWGVWWWWLLPCWVCVFVAGANG